MNSVYRSVFEVLVIAEHLDNIQDNGDINCYAVQTIQPLHKRVNGHRSCFDVNENL